MAADLQGSSVGAWIIEGYIDNGKSAVVCRAKRQNQEAALKVFDLELIERYGKDTQSERIGREKSLIGKSHRNLVKIWDGGYCNKTNLFFVAMELLTGKTLSKSLDDVSPDEIVKITKQVASAAKFLEDLEPPLAHRDIKPSNIIITDDNEAVLLDLGVLRPIEGSDVTDESAKPFIGTLRYSPPEFLLRQEEDSLEGWRAVTFYQIGAVLHDLIMRKPLFEEDSEPFARLVFAVKEKVPLIKSNEVSLRLLQLSRNCLVKNPDVRLNIVKWEDFEKCDQSKDTLEEVKRRIQNRKLTLVGKKLGSDLEMTENEKFRQEQRINSISDEIFRIIRGQCVSNRDFPPIDITYISSDDPSCKRFLVRFSRSTAYNLPHFLTIGVSISFLEVDSQAVQVAFTGLISDEQVLEENVDFQNLRILFTGVFDSEMLKQQTDRILYELLDKAQELLVQPTSCFDDCIEVKGVKFKLIHI